MEQQQNPPLKSILKNCDDTNKENDPAEEVVPSTNSADTIPPNSVEEEEIPNKRQKMEKADSVIPEEKEHDEMQYLRLIQTIIDKGKSKGDRTGLVLFFLCSLPLKTCENLLSKALEVGLLI